MKQGIVKFSKEFVTDTGLKEWAGIELPFNEERESGVDALRRAETIVNEYQRPKSYLMQHEIIYPSQYGPADIIAGRSSEDERIANLIRNMYECTQIDGDDGLMSFSKLASGNRETQNVFDIVFTKLSKNAKD